MRKLLIAVLAALPPAAPAAAPNTVAFDFKNMTCEVCPITVRKSLEKLPGVSGVKVDFDRKTVTVTYDPDQVRPEAMSKATTNAGYPSIMQR